MPCHDARLSLLPSSFWQEGSLDWGSPLKEKKEGIYCWNSYFGRQRLNSSVGRKSWRRNPGVCSAWQARDGPDGKSYHSLGSELGGFVPNASGRTPGKEDSCKHANTDVMGRKVGSSEVKRLWNQAIIWSCHTGSWTSADFSGKVGQKDEFLPLGTGVLFLSFVLCLSKNLYIYLQELLNF